MSSHILCLKGVLTTILVSLAFAAFGQSNGNAFSVKLTDSSRPPLVKVSILNGSITVKGYAGNEVKIESNQRGLDIQESENEVSVRSGPVGVVDLRIMVPFQTSLQLKCVTGGNIEVQEVEGEFEVNGSNASITLRKVSGVVLAHSLQGRVLVQMNKVTPGKPMSFSTMNGDIDVSLPPDTKADIKLQTVNGAVHTDFPIKSTTAPGPGSGMKVSASINGGGPEIQLKTINGSVFLRHAKPASP